MKDGTLRLFIATLEDIELSMRLDETCEASVLKMQQLIVDMLQMGETIVEFREKAGTIIEQHSKRAYEDGFMDDFDARLPQEH